MGLFRIRMEQGKGELQRQLPGVRPTGNMVGEMRHIGASRSLTSYTTHFGT